MAVRRRHTFPGSGADEDIVVSSARAYVSALNKVGRRGAVSAAWAGLAALPFRCSIVKGALVEGGRTAGSPCVVGQRREGGAAAVPPRSPSLLTHTTPRRPAHTHRAQAIAYLAAKKQISSLKKTAARVNVAAAAAASKAGKAKAPGGAASATPSGAAAAPAA